jgi:hypothetical protein
VLLGGDSSVVSVVGDGGEYRNGRDARMAGIGLGAIAVDDDGSAEAWTLFASSLPLHFLTRDLSQVCRGSWLCAKDKCSQIEPNRVEMANGICWACGGFFAWPLAHVAPGLARNRRVGPANLATSGPAAARKSRNCISLSLPKVHLQP